MSDLQTQILIMKDKLEAYSSINEIKEHLDEINTIIDIYCNTKFDLEKNFVSILVQDALNHAQETLNKYTIIG